MLAYLLEQPAERAVIERMFAAQSRTDDLQRKLRNLSAAGQGYATTMIRELAERWTTEPAGWLSQRIQLLPYCAEAAPVQTAQMCVDAAHARALTANDVASIVSSLGRSDATRGLRLVWELAALDQTLAPFPVHAVVNRLLNPVFHSPDKLTLAGELLEIWVRAPMEGRRPEAFSDALLALFTTVAKWDTNNGAALTMHEEALLAAPRLLEIRRTATRVLGEMLGHSDSAVRMRAVTVLQRHGAPHIGHVTTDAFRHAAADEFRSLVPTIADRLSNESEVSILATLYVTLATRWAAGRPGAIEADNYSLDAGLTQS